MKARLFPPLVPMPATPAPRVAGSDTSGAAADSLVDSLPALRRAVYHYIDRDGGATCDEVEVGLELRHQTASARIRELFLADLLFDSGIRRQTRSGRLAVVWKVKK